jgi:eukaryotic-like serine/threonine-protein kinase
MTPISSEWKFVEPLNVDTSAYGRLMVVKRDDDDQPYVGKAVPAEVNAVRELQIGEDLTAKNVANVIPIIDSGIYQNYYVMIMPMADQSLRDTLNGRVTDREQLARDVVRDVCIALVSIAERVIHRDIKPENILFMDGRWQLADFGISKYQDRLTETYTRKSSNTPVYASPEQLTDKALTSKSDVYSLGVVAYEILFEMAPFQDGGQATYTELHNESLPPDNFDANNAFHTQIWRSLLKQPTSRPSPAEILSSLDAPVGDTLSAGTHKLRLALAHTVREQAKREAEMQKATRRADEQSEKLDDAKAQANLIVERLGSVLDTHFPPSTRTPYFGTSAIDTTIFRSGNCALTISDVREFTDWELIWSHSQRVIAHCSLDLRLPTIDSQTGWYGFSHSMWFTDIFSEGDYVWVELAFESEPSRSGPSNWQPTSKSPRQVDLVELLAQGNASKELVTNARLLTPLQQDEFIDRWVGWVADAVMGKLQLSHIVPGRNSSSSPD